MQKPDELDMCVATLLSLKFNVEALVHTYTEPHHKGFINAASKVIDLVVQCLAGLNKTP